MSKLFPSIKSKFISLKSAYSSINEQSAHSFAVPLVVSFVVFIFSTTISLIINGHMNDLSLALPAYCSSLFSTVITFCLTTTIQNFFEMKYSDKDRKKQSSKINICSGIYTLSYLFFYFIYLLATSLILGIVFLIFSAVAILLSLLAFIETYQTENNSISG